MCRNTTNTHFLWGGGMKIVVWTFCCVLKFLREKLFDYVDIATAPVLIDGKDAATLISRRSQLLESELSKLDVLKL